MQLGSDTIRDSYAATEYIRKTDPVAEKKGFEPLIARKMRRGSPLDLLLRERDRGFESLFLQRGVSSKLGSDTSAMEASAEPGTRPLTTPVTLNQVPWRSKLVPGLR